MWPGMLPPKSNDPPKHVGPAIACISRGPGETWCGRDHYSSEFVFQDAPHAVRHYADGIHLRACPKCVEACKDRVSGGADFIKHFATRGLENDR